jgi:hypothetical protein
MSEQIKNWVSVAPRRRFAGCRYRRQIGMPSEGLLDGLRINSLGAHATKGARSKAD